MTLPDLAAIVRQTPGAALIALHGPTIQHTPNTYLVDGEYWRVIDLPGKAEADVLAVEAESRRDEAEEWTLDNVTRELARQGAHHHGF